MNRLASAAALTMTWGLIACGFAASSAAASSGALPITESARASTAKPSLSAPGSVTEGDRYEVTAKVTHLSAAKTIAFQQLLSEYPYSTTSVWTTVQSRRAASSRAAVLKLLADTSSSQRIRTVVTYASGARATSRPATVKIWHWIDLYQFRPYYSVGGISANEYTQFAMNGDTWLGWESYTSADMWESRHTLGRNCKAFRGTLGVTDYSSDGVTANFTLLTDETNAIYTSPDLAPGVVENVELPLAKPYRFSIQARDTTADSQTPHNVYPAIGAPQFLCHFD